ncbi:MAG: DUF58 domain-containing protein [Alcanivoracaceae bacterium]
MMLRPSPALLRAAVLLLLLALLPLAARLWLPDWREGAETLWLLAALMLVMTLGWDIARAWSRPLPRATRLTPAAFSVQRDHTIRVRFASSDLPSQCELADHHPADDPNTGLPALLRPAAAATTEFSYRYRPSRRGKAVFGDIELWLPGPLGLIWLRRRIGAACEVPVYPDFSMLQSDALKAQKHSRLDAGSRQQPRRGEGMEFHQLREYRPGDALRQIDWKASARRRSLISREYQEEQNQHIIVLLDGGARLAMRVNGMTGFDHALNASLLLAWSGLKQGDRPGVLLFSNDEERWLPPVRGQQGLNRLLNALYTLHPGNRASDYSLAARKLMGHWSRHSLVVLISHIQPDDEQELMTAVKLLSGRHLLMIADIQLPSQARLRHCAIDTVDDALRVAGDAGWQEARLALHARLRHAGALVVEATPEHLPAKLNQVYLSLKRSGQL